MGEKIIFLTDMQSFYATVEKVRDHSLKDKPVIVAGDPERRSGIVLAACPIAKKYGITTAETLGSAKLKCPHVEVVRPHMQQYIDVSIQITKIMEQFTDLVEPFSIDEQFMDVTGSQKLFGDQFEIAKKVQAKILEDTGVYSRVGIGPNKILAKMACDNFAKKNKDGIFRLDESNIDQLWKMPIGNMFGVGSKMERHLRGMGIFTIGGLAKHPLPTLKKKWGINGEVLWQTANGIDYSPVTVKTHNQQKAVGHHMTLPRDYKSLKEIKIVLLELCTEVARRCRKKGYMGVTVSFGVRGADFDFPTGFHRQVTLPLPTNYDLDIFNAAYKLLLEFWDREPVRSLGVSLSNLQPSDNYQIDLFDNYLLKESLNSAFDVIWDKYGRRALYRASSLTAAGQASERAVKIGGHYK
ncbi:DNA polymerase IV [Lederbergia wuyishanensis]|uniref:DNA polymerase IV n=1 Tax=Lederbergia wuyishanensis TaxID=1347903 RepID=A0ABU0D4E2_9BACI|nr:DNA polymerase IV [Lederbergia wuyishanensis]MCJ8008133.1 DNA polymerase IV [Lederbergia wuyishanensis]MDQ0343281.1 nucleotidyltransferase/DNA polymerase involved in DNA repair [Lederbergia wuyishanensis]